MTGPLLLSVTKPICEVESPLNFAVSMFPSLCFPFMLFSHIYMEDVYFPSLKGSLFQVCPQVNDLSLLCPLFRGQLQKSQLCGLTQ